MQEKEQQSFLLMCFKMVWLSLAWTWTWFILCQSAAHVTETTYAEIRFPCLVFNWKSQHCNPDNKKTPALIEPAIGIPKFLFD